MRTLGPAPSIPIALLGLRLARALYTSSGEKLLSLIVVKGHGMEDTLGGLEDLEE